MMMQMLASAARSAHLSHRERSDCIARCNPGEGLRSPEFAASPHPALRADLSAKGEVTGDPAQAPGHWECVSSPTKPPGPDMS